MVIAGLALAPSAAAGYLVVDHVAPPGTVTEATTWVMTANVAGGALGAALGGIVVQDVSVRAGLILACVGPLLGTFLTLARRRTLEGEPATARVS
jgi:predicted MFS family arabinose efflux permease